MALWEELNGPWCGLNCERSSVNALDRSVIGNNSHAASIAGDVLLGASFAYPFVFGLIDQLVSDPQDGWAGYGKDSLILAETFVVGCLVNQIFKYSVRRPRPYVYDETQEEDKRTSVRAALSFFSGHATHTFSMATAYPNSSGKPPHSIRED